MTSVHASNDVRIFHKMCVSLAAAGYDTWLVAPGESREEKGVHVVGVGMKPSSRMKRMTQMTRRVYKKALELEADIYHFHDPELLPWGLKLKKKGKKVIFDSHEFYVAQIKGKHWLPRPIRNIVAGLYQRYEAYVCARLDAVVAVCTISGENYFERWAKHVVLIANDPLLSELPASLGGNTSKLKERAVCYAGGLTHERGITYLIEALEHVDARLYLAGVFASGKYLRTLEKKPGWEKVCYLGFLNRQQIWELYEKCLAGVSTLLDVGQYYSADTFPIKVLEYMAAGRPVITNTSPMMKQTVGAKQYGICVDPDKPRQIADAIKYFLNNPDEAHRMGENGRKAVLERYNWIEEEKKLINLYENITNQNTDEKL